MIKTIIFDIAKVITFGDFHRAYFDFAEKFQIDGAMVADFHEKNLAQLLTGEISTADTRVAFGLENYSDEDILNGWKEVIVPLWRIDETMIALLKQLREKYQVIALSNLTEARYGADMAMNLYDHFDRVVLSYKEGLKKPNAAIYNLALESTNTIPAESVFIDDQEKNVRAAEKLGMNGIVFTNYQNLLGELADLGVVV